MHAERKPDSIVLFSTQIWTDNWVSKHWIAHLLAEAGYRVLFIEPLRGIWLRGGRLRDLFIGPRIRREHNVEVISFSSIPGYYRTRGPLRSVLRWILEPQFMNLRKRLKENTYVLLTFDGRSLPFLKRLPRPKRSAYYCVDPVGLGAETRACEEHLCRHVDNQIAISQRCAQEMQDDLGLMGVEVVPHGILLEDAVPGFTNTGSTISTESVWDSEKIIIGYTGSIHDRYVDFEKIKKASDAYRSWEWVFVGPYRNSDIAEDASNAINELIERPKMHFLGSKPVWELPEYIAHFDVCIIPYRSDIQNGWGRRSPVKILHYLRQGKPIVCADVPGVLAYKDLIYIYRNDEEFIGALQQAASEPKDDPIRQDRKDFVKTRDARNILDQLKPLIGL